MGDDEQYSEAICLVKEHIDKHLCGPDKNWPEYWFKKISYSRYSAYEILRRILEHEPCIQYKEQTPVNIVKEFISQMKNYSEITDGKIPIFEIAEDEGQEILRLIERGPSIRWDCVVYDKKRKD